MKKLILTILTTITILGVNAQGNNLQFNRALTEIIDINPGIINNRIAPNAFTVPAGKVWKVNYFLFSSGNINGNYVNDQVHFSFAGQNNFVEFNQSGYKNGPLWIKSGTYDVLDDNYQASEDNFLFISGIEFNIVQ